MRVLPWSNTFVSVGQVGINFSSFGEPASRLLVQLNVRNMEEGKIATAWAQFDVRLKEVHHVYKNACATLE
jgi:hypothetical protein